MPVNKRFGFSISSSGSVSYSPRNTMSNNWRGVTSATTGAAFPDTTTDKPYLSDYNSTEGPFQRKRYSFAATVDYRLASRDRLSFSVAHTYFGAVSNNHTLAFGTGGTSPGNFGVNFTHGLPGAGNFRITQVNAERNAFTFMPTLTYRHEGTIWKAEAGAGYSHASDRLGNADKGFFQNAQAQRTGVTVSFDDINYLRPGRITVTDANGAPVNPYDIASYAVSSASALQSFGRDTQRKIYANVARDFDGRVPFTLKLGFDIGNSVRDVRQQPGGVALTYVGADGRPSSTPVGSDDTAVPFFDTLAVGREVGFGLPAGPTLSNAALLTFYRANPGRFTTNESTNYISAINVSKRAEETISAVYVRGDAQFFERRLKLVGGLRAEQTNDVAEGPRTDPTGNYQRDVSGKIILVNNRPVLIATDPLEVTKLTRIDRGNHVEKEYLRLFPSLNASFNLRPNLIARGAAYTSVGRPNFNQYAGGLTLPDLQAVAGPGNRITVNNAGIKAWSAHSVRFSLEYYLAPVGLFSAGVFRRDFKNFFGATVFDATPEFLALYSLDPAVYGGYQVETQSNVTGGVRMEGFNFNYKQALTFLPRWARGVQVFANTSVQRATGDATANFSAYIPQLINWGVSLNRQRYELRANWNYRGRARGDAVTGRGIEAGTYVWNSKRLYVDLSGEYRFLRHYAVFFKMRNLNDTPEDIKTFGPHTPAGTNFRSRIKYGSLWTLGCNAKF